MRRTSIRFRMIVLMMLLTTLPVATMTWIATYNTRETVEIEIKSANESRLAGAEQFLGELIRQIDTLFVSLQINEELMNSMQDIDHQSRSVQLQTQSKISNTLYSAFHANSRIIDELTLYTHDSLKTFTVNFPGGRASELDILETGWHRIVEEPVHIYFKIDNSRIWVFHSINRFEDQALLGGIAARLDQKVWQELMTSVRTEEESSLFLLNDEHEVLINATPEEAGFDVYDFLAEAEWPLNDMVVRAQDHLVFVQPISGERLTVIKSLPLETIASSTRATIRAGVLTGGLFATISLVLSVLFALRITRPIVRLARTMRSANINQFETFEVPHRDELGLLERGYNTMMRRLREMVEIEYRREIQMKNALLKALQAQIHPHFLNNTLQMIGGMALKHQAPDIYRITKGVGDLLRYAINEGDELVTLSKELEHVRNYVFIQEQRFKGRVTVEWSIDSRALTCLVAKFLLQPMVENAFEHGLQRKEGSWHLQIRVRKIGQRVAVIIHDNGVGMSPETLTHLRQGLSSGQLIQEQLNDVDTPYKRRGIGLGNVHDRIKLHGGNGSALRLFSESGTGTMVVIVLPMTD